MPRAGSKRKNFATRAGINDLTPSKEAAFRMLQSTLLKLLFLAYFNSKRPLYINLNASKVFSFRAIIYYIDGELDKDFLRYLQVYPVLFLSRLLKDTETYY